MSFSAHPYLVMTLTIGEVTGEVGYECDSCGGAGESFLPGTPVETIIRKYHEHLRRSHRLTREDVKDWYSHRR